MTLKVGKPPLMNDDVLNFINKNAEGTPIKEAPSEPASTESTAPAKDDTVAPTRRKPTSTAGQEVKDIFIAPKDKTFLLRMSPVLWREAKKQAEDSKISLHDYIIKAIIEKVR